MEKINPVKRKYFLILSISFFIIFLFTFSFRGGKVGFRDECAYEWSCFGEGSPLIWYLEATNSFGPKEILYSEKIYSSLIINIIFWFIISLLISYLLVYRLNVYKRFFGVKI